MIDLKFDRHKDHIQAQRSLHLTAETSVTYDIFHAFHARQNKGARYFSVLVCCETCHVSQPIACAQPLCLPPAGPEISAEESLESFKTKVSSTNEYQLFIPTQFLTGP
jgi:hypothetical protein